MEAIVWTKYGRPDDVLELQDVDKPLVKDDEVLVRVHAAALNGGDSVSGVPYFMRMAPPGCSSRGTLFRDSTWQGALRRSG